MVEYNEVYDNLGFLRPAYASLQARTDRNLVQPSAYLIKELAKKGVVGKEGLYSVPLVIDENEYLEKIVPSVLQRAFVLQELFADIAMGSVKIVESGLLSEDELDRILHSEGIDLQTVRRMWRGQLLDQIRFVYGPDMIRDPCGSWVLLEDNIGCIGGVGDAPVVLERFIKASGIELHPDLEQNSILKETLRAFLVQAGLAQHSKGLYGIPGVSSDCTNSGYDFETAWKSSTLQSLGITVKIPEELLRGFISGIYKPSALINLSATLTPAYQQLAREVFKDQRIPIIGGPGVGLVASKSFHALGDALVSLYLDEHSLLEIPPTQLLRVIPNILPEKGVLKRSNGCRGTEVFFLSEMRERDAREKLLEKLKQWGPCQSVIQKQINRSIIMPSESSLEAASIEIRPIVYVCGWKTALVDKVIAGRATQRAANQLGNVSRGAQFLPVLREVVN